MCPCSSQHFYNCFQPKSQTTEPAQNPCHSDVVTVIGIVQTRVPTIAASATRFQLIFPTIIYQHALAKSWIVSLHLIDAHICWAWWYSATLQVFLSMLLKSLTMTMLERKTLQCQLQCDIIPKHSHNGNIYPPMSVITPVAQPIPRQMLMPMISGLRTNITFLIIPLWSSMIINDNMIMY